MAEPATHPFPVPEPAPMRPVAAGERVDLIDILRGFALFGILLVNMQMFIAPLYLWFSGVEWWDAPIDKLASLFVRFAGQGKFYTLFATLFGLGFAIQMERAEARGASPGKFFSWRVTVLLAIGMVHAFLIWFGDILVTYAIFGFLLIPFRKRKNKTLIVWAVLLFLLPLLIGGGLAAVVEVVQLLPDGNETMAEQRETQRAANLVAIDQARDNYSSGDPGLIMQQRAEDVLLIWMITFAFGFGVGILGLFILGLLVGRYRVLHDAPRHVPWIRRWIWIFAAVGLPCTALGLLAQPEEAFIPSARGFLSQALLAFGTPAMTAFYVSGIILLFQKAAWKRRLTPLGALGRMALTNYLMQSLICTAIFNGYGWKGLYGQFPTSWGLGLTFVIYLAQIPLSVFWLRRFRFGPMEWVWRSLTYRRLQPMRR